MLRFHLPLIEPDVQISRIRLSDKSSGVRSRQARSLRTQLDEAKLVVEILVRKACILSTPHLVLVTEPPAEPAACVLLHHFIDSDHGPQTEVVRPAA